MNFEHPASPEQQEKEPASIAEWVGYFAPEVRAELVDRIGEEEPEDGRRIPAAYCFDGDDPKDRKNERIEIRKESNETNKAPINVASHELRHKKQRDFEAREEIFEMFTVEQVKNFLKGFNLNVDNVDELVSGVEDGPREVDAIFFSFFVENGIRINIISKEEIPGLLDMDSNQIICLLKDRINTSEYKPNMKE